MCGIRIVLNLRKLKSLQLPYQKKSLKAAYGGCCNVDKIDVRKTYSLFSTDALRLTANDCYLYMFISV